MNDAGENSRFQQGTHPEQYVVHGPHRRKTLIAHEAQLHKRQGLGKLELFVQLVSQALDATELQHNYNSIFEKSPLALGKYRKTLPMEAGVALMLRS